MDDQLQTQQESSAADSTEDLRRAMHSLDAVGGNAAVDRVCALPEPQRLELLCYGLVSPNPIVGSLCAENLEPYGEPAVETLLDAAGSSACHILVKLRVLTALGRIRSHESLAALVVILQQAPEESIRYTIIQAIGEIGNPAAIPVLQEYLTADNHHVREHAAYAIKKLEDDVG